MSGHSVSHLFVGLLDLGLSVVPYVVNLVDGGLELLADFLSRKKNNYLLTRFFSCQHHAVI